jgi:hypothetical protein
MVELVDTQVSEACGRKAVEVQVLFRALNYKQIKKINYREQKISSKHLGVLLERGLEGSDLLLVICLDG